MKLDLFQSKDHKREETFSVSLEELGIEKIDGVEPLGDFTINCRIIRNDDIVRVSGKVTVNANVECARCLDPIEHEWSGSFTVVAKKTKKGESLNDSETSDNDEINYIILKTDENSIELSGFVHDALLLDVPFKIVCGENCRGLCPACGIKLGNEPCDCSSSHADERWQDLKNLLDNNGSKNKN